jgi:hypothetical protein
LRACDKLSLFNFLFFLFSFSRHSKWLQWSHTLVQKSSQNLHLG